MVLRTPYGSMDLDYTFLEGSILFVSASRELIELYAAHTFLSLSLSHCSTRANEMMTEKGYIFHAGKILETRHDNPA